MRETEKVIMAKKLTLSIALVLLCIPVLQGRQAGEASFIKLEKAVKQEPASRPWNQHKTTLIYFPRNKRRSA